MIDILLWVAGFLGYLAIGVLIAGIAAEEDVAFETVFLWPFVAAFAALFYPLYWLYRALKDMKWKNISIPKRKTAEQKVIEYSQSPTKVLAQIISAKMLANVNAFNDTDKFWQISQEGKTIKIRVYQYSDDLLVQQVIVNGKDINFPKTELKLLTDTYKKALKLREDRLQAEHEANEQLKALEAVESLLLTPEKSNVE